MEFTWKVNWSMIFTREGEIIWKATKLGKTQWNESIIYGVKIKQREGRKNWKEEREKSNREKDYGRLRGCQWKWGRIAKREEW